MNKKYGILEILFPTVRAQVLQLLFGISLKQRYVREIARRSGLSLHTVQEELHRLSAIGLIKSSSNGFRRFYSANRRHPFFRHLQEMVSLSGRVAPMNRSVFARVRRLPSSNAKGPSIFSSRRTNPPPNWGLFSKSRPASGKSHRRGDG
jgi:hypothetical protein